MDASFDGVIALFITLITALLLTASTITVWFIASRQASWRPDELRRQPAYNHLIGAAAALCASLLTFFGINLCQSASIPCSIVENGWLDRHSLWLSGLLFAIWPLLVIARSLARLGAR